MQPSAQPSFATSGPVRAWLAQKGRRRRAEAGAQEPAENTTPAVIAVQGGGDPDVGCVLAVDAPGEWDGDGALSYQWLRDGAATGRTGQTYQTAAEDEGKEITALEYLTAGAVVSQASNGITITAP